MLLHHLTLLVGMAAFGRFGGTSSLVCIHAFVPTTHFHHPSTVPRFVSRLTSTETIKYSSDSNDDDDTTDVDDINNDDDDISFLFDEPEPELDVTEKAWRYAKKPLLRIGSKGATHAHGNSLRQLLEDHTVVRVKVNTKKFNNSVQQAHEVLRGLAIENGAPANLELIQIREGSKEIMFGMPGTLQRMEEGLFPPAVSVPDADQDDDDDEE